MTREQAIEVLKNRYYSGVTRSRGDDEWRLATDTAIAALREQAHEWVRTTDRLPTEEGVDNDLCVLAIVSETQTIIISRYEAMDMLDNADRLTYSHWMPLPKLPEVDDD